MQLRLIYLASIWLLSALPSSGTALDHAGPLFHRGPLTITQGQQIEALGPFFRFQRSELEWGWAIPPLMAFRADEITDFSEFEFLYPIFSYDRFGPAFRAQVLQIISFSGGETLADEQNKRVTLFPFYFHQRSTDPAQRYTALLPLYGRLRNRLLRDEIEVVMFPAYSKTRKKDVVTRNFLYPIFHLRQGPGLEGWQAWPLAGFERRIPLTQTNDFGEGILLEGHEKMFILWPFYLQSHTGMGTANPQTQRAVLPFFSQQRSPERDSSTYLWPFGFTFTEDREKNYREWAFPWPLIVFARGEGKHANRIWPFFSRAKNPTLESNFYLWPLFKVNRARAEPLDRERTRILLFLYSDLTERNTATRTALRRIDFWPLFTQRTDHTGNRRLQVLSVLEPLLPNNKSIERTYSPVWSVWRSEYNAKTGDSSQSLLWNLYRRERSSEKTKLSILFGLLQYESDKRGAHWRLLYIPTRSGKSRKE